MRAGYDLSFDVFHNFPSVSVLSKVLSVFMEKNDLKKVKLRKQKFLTLCKHSFFLNVIPILSFPNTITFLI